MDDIEPMRRLSWAIAVSGQIAAPPITEINSLRLMASPHAEDYIGYELTLIGHPARQ
jgi:hypothetical protein